MIVAVDILLAVTTTVVKAVVALATMTMTAAATEVADVIVTMVTVAESIVTRADVTRASVAAVEIAVATMTAMKTVDTTTATKKEPPIHRLPETSPLVSMPEDAITHARIVTPAGKGASQHGSRLQHICLCPHHGTSASKPLISIPSLYLRYALP